MKKILITCFLWCVLCKYVAAQLILSPLDAKDSTILKGEYVAYNTLFDEMDVEFLAKTQQFFKKIIYLVTTESVSSTDKVVFSHQLFVSKDGYIKGFYYSFSGGDFKITDAQQKSLKEKIVQYAEGMNLELKTTKDWQMQGMAMIPKLQSKRFYKDYLAPNPAPTAPENTKLGLIQRLGNQCTTIWEGEGGRNPMDLRFLGLVNVCMFNLTNANPLYAQLRQLTLQESADSIHKQIFSYMYANCPIVKAKYGNYGILNKVYDDFAKSVCDCVSMEYPKRRKGISDEDDEIFYDVDEKCKEKAGKALSDKIKAERDKVIEAAKQKDEYLEVAVNIFAFGLVGEVPFHCGAHLEKWGNNFVNYLRSDSMRYLSWSERRKILTSVVFNHLGNQQPENFKKAYKSADNFDKNRNDLQQIGQKIKENEAKVPKMMLMKQHVETTTYVETVNVVDEKQTETLFQFKIYYDKANGAENLVKIEYVPKEKITRTSKMKKAN